MNYAKKESAIVVPMPMHLIVNDIGERFSKKFGRTFVISDGIRTPLQQAAAMHNNFSKENGVEKQRRIYRHKDLFDEIARAYEEQQRAKEACLEAMAEVIRGQVARGRFISLHLRHGAVDIRTSNLTNNQTDFLIDEIRKNPRLLVLDKREYKNPHLHLQFR